MQGIGLGALAGTVSGQQSPGDYVVGVDSRRAVQDAERRAESITRVLEFGPERKAVAGQFSQSAIENLRKNPSVRYIEQDGPVQATAQSLPWGVDRIDAEKAHAGGETGAGVHVAVLDSGIQPDHPDLQANLGQGHAVVECSGCQEPWADDSNHGTLVAGIIAAIDDAEGVVGVAPDATLHSVKVLDEDGVGTFSGVAEGIQIATDEGYDVINLSLSGGNSQVMAEACEYAHLRDVLLVGSAGNGGTEGGVNYPAGYTEVMAIAASTEDDTLATFSDSGHPIAVIAPGVGVLSTAVGGTYEKFSGTSASAPHVAGTAALLLAQGMGSRKARFRIRFGAEDLGLRYFSQGSGIPDAAFAALGGLEVRTRDATEVGTSTATLNGRLLELGGATSVDLHFEWRETGAADWNTTAVQTVSGPTDFAADVGNLAGDTDHEFRAVAEAGDGTTDTGTILSFTTIDPTPDVTWDQPDDGETLAGCDIFNVVAASDETDDRDDLVVEWRIDDTDWRRFGRSGQQFKDKWDARNFADGDHTLDARATDTDGNATVEGISITIDNEGLMPRIDRIDPFDDKPDDSEVRLNIDWAVSDPNDNLREVKLSVYNVTLDSVVDFVKIDISGGTASQVTEFRYDEEDDTSDGDLLEVTLEVTDTDIICNREVKELQT